jgi:hypothetical protein
MSFTIPFPCAYSREPASAAARGCRGARRRRLLKERSSSSVGAVDLTSRHWAPLHI